jgi:hypothetical protein
VNCVINFHENSIGSVLQNLDLILGSSLRKMLNFFLLLRLPIGKIKNV